MKSTPGVFLHCRHVHGQLTHVVQQAVQQNQGTECLLLVVDALQEEAAKLLQEAQDHADAESISSQEQLNLNTRDVQLGRRSIWYLCPPASLPPTPPHSLHDVLCMYTQHMLRTSCPGIAVCLFITLRVLMFCCHSAGSTISSP